MVSDIIPAGANVNIVTIMYRYIWKVYVAKFANSVAGFHVENFVEIFPLAS